MLTLAVGLTLSISSLAQKTTTIKEKNAHPSFLKWIEVRKASEQGNSEELTAIMVYTCTKHNKDESCEPLVDKVVTLNELRNTLKGENLKAGGLAAVGILLGTAMIVLGPPIMVATGTGTALAAAGGTTLGTTLAAAGTTLGTALGGAAGTVGADYLFNKLIEGSRLRKLLSKKDVLFVRNIDNLEQNLEYLLNKIILKRDEPKNYVR